MRARLPFEMICLSLVAGASMPAYGQSKDQQNRTAYGSRVGDRDQDPNNAGLNGDRRTSRRIDSRIDSRLQTRLNRFTDQQTDVKNAYTPKVDDGTKGKP